MQVSVDFRLEPATIVGRREGAESDLLVDPGFLSGDTLLDLSKRQAALGLRIVGVHQVTVIGRQTASAFNVLQLARWCD